MGKLFRERCYGSYTNSSPQTRDEILDVYFNDRQPPCCRSWREFRCRPVAGMLVSAGEAEPLPEQSEAAARVELGRWYQ